MTLRAGARSRLSAQDSYACGTPSPGSGLQVAIDVVRPSAGSAGVSAVMFISITATLYRGLTDAEVVGVVREQVGVMLAHR